MRRGRARGWRLTGSALFPPRRPRLPPAPPPRERGKTAAAAPHRAPAPRSGRSLCSTLCRPGPRGCYTARPTSSTLRSVSQTWKLLEKIFKFIIFSLHQGLNKDSRSMCNWDKQLNASQEVSDTKDIILCKINLNIFRHLVAKMKASYPCRGWLATQVINNCINN